MTKHKKGYSLKEQVQIFYVVPLGWKTFITKSATMLHSSNDHQCKGSVCVCLCV